MTSHTATVLQCSVWHLCMHDLGLAGICNCCHYMLSQQLLQHSTWHSSRQPKACRIQMNAKVKKDIMNDVHGNTWSISLGNLTGTAAHKCRKRAPLPSWLGVQHLLRLLPPHQHRQNPPHLQRHHRCLKMPVQPTSGVSRFMSRKNSEVQSAKANTG